MVTSAIMLSLAAFLLPILLFMTYKIARMVLPNEKEVVVMLVFLCLTLMAEMALWSANIHSRLDPGWCCKLGTNCYHVSAVICRASSIFLGNAIIFNIYKWCYFKLKVDAYVRIYLQQDSQESEGNRSVESHIKSQKTSDVFEQSPLVEKQSNLIRNNSIVDTSDQE